MATAAAAATAKAVAATMAATMAVATTATTTARAAAATEIFGTNSHKIPGRFPEDEIVDVSKAL